MISKPSCWHQTICVVFVLGEILEDFWSLRWHLEVVIGSGAKTRFKITAAAAKQTAPKEKGVRWWKSIYPNISRSAFCVYWYWLSHLFCFCFICKYYDDYYLKWGGKKDLICRNILPASLPRKDARSGLVPSWEETKSRRWVILIKASRAAAATPDDETSASTRLLAAQPHFFTLQICAESVLIDAVCLDFYTRWTWTDSASHAAPKHSLILGRCRFTASSDEPKPSALINRRWMEDQNISRIHLRVRFRVLVWEKMEKIQNLRPKH